MTATLRLGCVSYLNAKPLIDGIEAFAPDVPVRFDVPSGLLDDLERGDMNIALCPVIDYFRSHVPLEIVPVGGIGCDGPTLTVRIYSACPLEQVRTIHADTDSHTSVALMRVVLRKLHGLTPTIIDYNTREPPITERFWPDTMLLIGDKVVTDSPPAVRYPHQLDLGEAWKRLTGLPFVFAVWMARRGAALGRLPDALDACRSRNASRIDEIVARHAPVHGWPTDLARHYLGDLLKFTIGPAQLDAIARFGAETAEVGVIDTGRTIVLHGVDSEGSDVAAKQTRAESSRV